MSTGTDTPPNLPSIIAAFILVLLIASLEAFILMLLIASLDQTIVATALSKLGDLFGGKPVLLIAIALFPLGSALCGAAKSIAEIIGLHALQGLGGGGLVVTAIAVVGDIAPPDERARLQGFFRSVLAVSTVAGLLLGGFIVEHFSWRWIFYLNLPKSLFSAAISLRIFPKTARTSNRRIDYAGLALLASCLGALVLGSLLFTGPTENLPAVALFGVATIAVLALFAVERDASEPILPLRALTQRRSA